MSSKIEIERKFVIQLPCIDKLQAVPGFESSIITQIYVKGNPGDTHRVRKREFADRIEYTENVKRRINKISAYEDERIIDEVRFKELSALTEDGTGPVYKTRCTVPFEGKTIEIDIYPEWQKSCIMEIELEREDEEIRLPEYIEPICEVTGDKKYSNHSMARSFPEELI